VQGVLPLADAAIGSIERSHSRASFKQATVHEVQVIPEAWVILNDSSNISILPDTFHQRHGVRFVVTFVPAKQSVKYDKLRG
jgi:hypothetical protein